MYRKLSELISNTTFTWVTALERVQERGAKEDAPSPSDRLKSFTVYRHSSGSYAWQCVELSWAPASLGFWRLVLAEQMPSWHGLKWCLDSPFSPGCCAEDSGHRHSSCVALSLFSAAYRLPGVLYGRGRWTGVLSGRRDYALLRNTNDHLLSPIGFLHFHSAYHFFSRSFTIHSSISSSFIPFVTRNQLFSPFSNPPHPRSLPPHNVKRQILTHDQSQPHSTHTLWRSVPLSSKLVPLSITRSASCICQWWLLSLSCPREQKIFVHTWWRKAEGWRAGQRGGHPTLECLHPMSG